MRVLSTLKIYIHSHGHFAINKLAFYECKSAFVVAHLSKDQDGAAGLCGVMSKEGFSGYREASPKTLITVSYSTTKHSGIKVTLSKAHITVRKNS